MTLLYTISLKEYIIDIHYNPNLKNKPFLIRLFNYDNEYSKEIRLDKEELNDLNSIYEKLKLDRG